MIGYIVRNIGKLQHVWEVEFNKSANEIADYEIIKIIYDIDNQTDVSSYSDGAILRRLILTDKRIIIREIFRS